MSDNNIDADLSNTSNSIADIIYINDEINTNNVDTSMDIISDIPKRSLNKDEIRAARIKAFDGNLNSKFIEIMELDNDDNNKSITMNENNIFNTDVSPIKKKRVESDKKITKPNLNKINKNNDNISDIKILSYNVWFNEEV